jgi:spore maturation protein CgeB
MRILFVDSGGLAFEARYAYGIYDTLVTDLGCTVRQVNPFHLTHQMIDEFQPELLLVVHGTFTRSEMVRYARARGTRTVLWLVEDPYEIDCHRGSMLESYDFVFTTERQAVHEYDHPHVYYLPWCCNPRVHRRISAPPAYRSDLCLVGVAFDNRVRILNAIAPQIKDLQVRLIGNWGNELLPELRKFIMPVNCDFWEVQKYYNGAKINLNIHRDSVDPATANGRGVIGVSPNDRTFALAGSGAFQIVDNTRPALWECFVKDQEMIGFDDARDLGDKIREYLAKNDRRRSIGAAAQQRAYREHRFKHRLEQMFQIAGVSEGARA